jgi:hypothetical protein
MRKTAELQVYRSAGFKCENPICDRTYPDHSLHVHHIIEAELGGPDTYENLILICAQCHSDLHRNGRFTRNDLREWKSLNAHSNHGWAWNAVTDAKTYLRFSLPNDLRKNRNLKIIDSALPAISALKSGDGIASIRLWLALARAFHRIGDTQTTTRILDELISPAGSDDLPFAAWPTELSLQAIHLRARSRLQASDVSTARSQFSEAKSIADDADIYGVEISTAEIMVDQLHVLYREEDNSNFLETASRFESLLESSRYSKGAQARSVRSQYHLYQGMLLGKANNWEDGERFVFKSIGGVARDNHRGLTIRYGLLGRLYLRAATQCRPFSRSKQTYMEKAISFYKRSIRHAKLPNECNVYVEACTALAHCAEVAGDATAQDKWENQAMLVAVGLQMDPSLYRDELARYLG